MSPADLMALARVVAPHGFKGGVKAACLTDAPDHLLKAESVWAYGPGRAEKKLQIMEGSLGGGFFF